MSSLVFLVLATEWFSRKGGVSTFNRELCRALNDAGHTVYCYVPAADLTEKKNAEDRGVSLLSGPPMSGADQQSSLYRRPPFPANIVPDVVIGHARFTGPAAKAQVDDYFREALRLHFLHFAPGEIEPHKAPIGGGGRTALLEQREQIEVDLAEGSDLAVAVGPQLYSEFKTLLIGRGARTAIHQLNPGIILREPARELPPQFRCLILGRMEDALLKGVDIAARAMEYIDTARLHDEPILIVRGAPKGAGDTFFKELENLTRVSRRRVRIREYTDNANQLWEDIRAASVVLMPSRAEGFGLVGLEAISFGVPVLLSEHSGLSKLLRSELRELTLPIMSVTGEVEKDARVWAHAIDAIRENRIREFQQIRLIGKELSQSLTWEFATRSLLNAISEAHKAKRPFSPITSTVGKAGVKLPTPLSSRAQREHFISRIRSVRKKAQGTLLSAETKWGPSLFSSTRKVANVCEVLLALDDEFISGWSHEVGECVSWLIAQQRQGGFPSLSRDTITTHCTALGAIACARAATWDVISKKTREMASSASEFAADACVRMADERGWWGTWGKGTPRIQPTLWALRAMTHFEKYKLELFRQFEQLRALHSNRHPGCFGFRPGTEPHVSPTACFLLLCSDLQKTGYKPGNRERFLHETHNAARFIDSQFRARGAWPTEIEGYYVDPDYLATVGHVEQLTWLHVSAPLAVEALARQPELTGTLQAEEGWLKGAAQLMDHFDPKSGMLQDSVFEEMGLSEPVFPTAYGCMALTALEQWLSRYDTLSERVEGPRILHKGNVIRKVAAAIVKNDRLLLVRKFGTDQLIMPGGGLEDGETPIAGLQREILEELGVNSLILQNEPIGIYRAPAAFEPGLDVEITLFRASLTEQPRPSGEIEEIVWHHPNESAALSLIIRDHILPSMLRGGLL